VLVLGERGVEVIGMGGHGRREGDRGLHRHLGAGADREVGGVRRVAEQGDRRAASPVPPPPRPAGTEVAHRELFTSSGWPSICPANNSCS
jgi:hypothetical protein